MNSRSGIAALLTLSFFVASCSDSGLVGLRPGSAPQLATVAAAAMPSVRISEIHYDNTGIDAGEAIEVSGPAGTSLTGWSLVLYNGSGGATYDTDALSGTIPATCGARGVVVMNYPSNGIQNGAPDGIALVNASGTVVEFLSYEGPMTATNGPAVGTTATDIGVSQNGTEALGVSLQRQVDGSWSTSAPHNFGACNDGTTEPPPPAVVTRVAVSPATATIVEGGSQTFSATAYDAADQPIAGATFEWTSSAPTIATVNPATGVTTVATGLLAGDATITAKSSNVTGSAALTVTAAPPTNTLPATRFSEIHYDNFGTDAGESIEVEGPAGTVLNDWSIVLYNGNGGVVYNTRPLTGTITNMCSGRGVIVATYPTDGLQNGAPDGFALVNAAGQVVEFLSYEGSFTATAGPAIGVLSTDIGASQTSATVGQSLRRDADGAWASGSSSFGACNAGGIVVPPPSSISFSGRHPTDDPALPVGFQDQIFATLRNGGTTVQTTFTWAAETPTIATIDQDGVITARTPGTATFRATAADGTTNTYSLPMHIATSSTTAMYGNHTEFGTPTDGDASNDYIVERREFTSSFNRDRGIPNWVSYNLEATHFGAQDRCDCFTFDPSLPASFPTYTTADYTGAGAFHGYSIDRGHFARSFDRTSGTADNAASFYFTNIFPQAADMNQGPWAIMENHLGDRARTEGREVYIITGAYGNKGTVKNEGKMVIPEYAWKVAVIMPRDQGLNDVDSFDDVEVIAAIMPNIPGIRNVDWNTYRTTVDEVERLSGYDVLALLPDQVEIAVESGTRPPTAVVNGPFSIMEGSSVSVSSAGSSDPDSDALTYSWTFGDGGTATGASASHTYAQDGSYVVTLTVTDSRGLVDKATTSATVANVAPSISAFSGASLAPLQPYSASGSFTDPGADSWTGTVNYGDGSGVRALMLTGKNFALAHTYAMPGTYTVTVTISDDDATSTRSATVTVLTPEQLIGNAIAMARGLMASGATDGGNAKALMAHLDAALKSTDKANTTPVLAQLQSALNQLDVMERAGRITAADAAPLRTAIDRIIRAIEG